MAIESSITLCKGAGPSSCRDCRVSGTRSVRGSRGLNRASTIAAAPRAGVERHKQLPRREAGRETVARIGFACGYDAAQDIRAFTVAMREADQLGFEIGFFSETLALMRDSVTAMTSFALA